MACGSRTGCQLFSWVVSLIDLILPSTDAGVLAQVLLVSGLLVLALLYFRSKREARFVIVGFGVLILSLMSLRALH